MLNWMKRWWNDPFHLNEDWDEFKKMSQEELKKEFMELLEQADSLASTTRIEDRLRRVCQYIALQWATGQFDDGNERVVTTESSTVAEAAQDQS